MPSERIERLPFGKTLLLNCSHMIDVDQKEIGAGCGHCNMSDVGTTRTCRGGPTTSAVGGRTDMPFKRADFRV